MRTFLVDGPSMMYRAIFAPGPRLTNAEGRPTAGTFYFTRMLLNLVRKHSIDYMAVAMDGPRSHLQRRRWYPQYKANRPTSVDPDLFVQLDDMVEILQALGLRVVSCRGWEADDVVATLARTMRGTRRYLVTRDKDFHQLLRPGVRCLDPQSLEVTTYKDLESKWGVTHRAQVLAVQALAGDPTDNVPGVRGVGMVKAAQLIQQYGSLDGVLANVEKLTPALKANVLATDLPLMERLVRLHSRLDLGIGKDDLRFWGLDMEAAKPCFKSLGFRRLLGSDR